jgi:hypothetical protein
LLGLSFSGKLTGRPTTNPRIYTTESGCLYLSI